MQGGNLYDQYFAEAGFYEVPLEQIQIGDALLMQIAPSQVINHAAVVTGVDEMLHHGYGRLSGYTAIGGYLKRTRKVVRHESFKR